MKHWKIVLTFIVGIAFGFTLRHFLPFYHETPPYVRSGLKVHTVIGIVEQTRNLELSEEPVITTEHILWYDRQSSIFAIDVEALEEDILEGDILAITINGEIASVVVYNGLRDDITMPAVFPTDLAGIYAIHWVSPLWGSTFNERIYAELEREGKLLEQISQRQVLLKFENLVGQSYEGRFKIDSLSIVTFEPTERRTTSADPIIVTITSKNTGVLITEFEHFFGSPKSLILDAGEYGIYVRGGGFVRDYYIISGICIASEV
ncbi:MAG: hypothetical protein FWE24_01605 [Defluviitaleaceae bacterium]|nr:hypothetical protein [Defluviitaleaceae bacterium]